MKQLLGEKIQHFCPQGCSKLLFYKRLPPATQNVLFCVKDSLDPDPIAKLADDFMATIPTPTGFTVSSVRDPGQTLSSSAPQVVSQLTTEVTSLKQQPRLRSPPSNRQTRTANDPLPTPQHRQSRPRSRSPGLCWYQTISAAEPEVGTPHVIKGRQTKRASISAARRSPNLSAAPPTRQTLQHKVPD
ncbi:hypothetical protein GWK47_031580 [Chionoecetes opilio]|uniref:Uncharacterized protein n=1 Tax=Chionoecetes opilio TaxID=41210 RepID=A0A8J5D226_CHIOP|nr:hypothetical protein GWK47_031580 [Chionoecetes opilio]